MLRPQNEEQRRAASATLKAVTEKLEEAWSLARRLENASCDDVRSTAVPDPPERKPR